MSLGKRQIYIVDDDESVCRALRFLMADHEFSVTTFTSAEDFFSAIPNSAPGCLILDIYMPKLDGWRAQQRLSKSGSKRPVIIVTADNSNDLKSRALEVGAVGFFQKPVSGHELIDLINKTYPDTSLSEDRMCAVEA